MAAHHSWARPRRRSGRRSATASSAYRETGLPGFFFVLRIACGFFAAGFTFTPSGLASSSVSQPSSLPPLEDDELDDPPEHESDDEDDDEPSSAEQLSPESLLSQPSLLEDVSVLPLQLSLVVSS